MALNTVDMRSENLLDTIGINTHIAWQDSGSAYTNQSNVANALNYLGVEYIRDGVPYENWTLPFYKSLADRGFKFDLLTTPGDFDKTGSFSTDLSHIDSLAQAAPGSIASIEGLNEINTWTVNYQGQNTGTNLALGRDIQALLYSQVHADPLLSHTPVLNLSTGGLTPQQASAMGDMSGMSDYGVWHTYFGQGDQPYANLASGVAAAKLLNPLDPVQITESNYYTAVDDMSWGGGGVTEEVQAKLGLNLVMDAAKLGVARTFLYELLDNNLSPANTIEGSFGVFHSDGSPKQLATAIHNLNAILNDSGADAEGFATSGLDFSVQGLGSNGRTLLLENSNGHHQLVVWAEPDIWNQDSRSAIGAPTQTVTVGLAQAAGSIQVFDPLGSTSAISTAENASSITVGVTDHPLIIDISGTGSAPAAAPATSGGPAATADGTAATIGSGPDALVVKLSEDAWNGDAQYTVSVDGQQIGGVQTASALHGAGESELLTVKGDWGAGDHWVGVSFLNDAYGGMPGADRNLVVEGISLNGAAQPGGTATMLFNGTSYFTVHDATDTGADWAL